MEYRILPITANLSPILISLTAIKISSATRAIPIRVIKIRLRVMGIMMVLLTVKTTVGLYLIRINSIPMLMGTAMFVVMTIEMDW